jgi:hypothetical protein
MSTPLNVVLLYRDDGPLALALGRVRAPLPWLLALLAATPPVVVAAATVSKAALLAAVGWAVILGGVGSSASHTGRVDWTAVPLLRTAEYAVIAIAGVRGSVSSPLVFALLCAIAFHDYDVVDRVRLGRAAIADRFATLRLCALGWDGRLALVAVGYAAGALTGFFVVGVAYLWLLFGWDSARGWLRRSPV